MKDVVTYPGDRISLTPQSFGGREEYEIYWVLILVLIYATHQVLYRQLRDVAYLADQDTYRQAIRE